MALVAKDAAAPWKALPSWAQGAFPDGLEKQGRRTWSVPSFIWDVRQQAALTLAAKWSDAREGEAASRDSEHLLKAAVGALGLDPMAPSLTLDLWSANGWCSALPWLRAMPQTHVVATDTAGMLLANLAGHAEEMGAGERLMGVMAEPLSALVAPGSVDFVTGVSCLHRLPDPDLAIRAAARALRSGGHAFFLEPFEGHSVLGLAFAQIVAEAEVRPESLQPAVLAAMRTLSANISARTLPDSGSAAFAALEEKWLFGREAIEGAARNAGFRDVRFLPHHDHETLYRDIGLIQIRAAANAPDAELPEWALAALDRFDQALRPPIKRLIMIEGTIALTR